MSQNRDFNEGFLKKYKTTAFSRVPKRSPHARLSSLCRVRLLVTPQRSESQPITEPSSQRAWSSRSDHTLNRYSSILPRAPSLWGRSPGRHPSSREPEGVRALAMTVLSATGTLSTWDREWGGGRILLSR